MNLAFAFVRRILVTGIAGSVLARTRASMSNLLHLILMPDDGVVLIFMISVALTRSSSQDLLLPTVTPGLYLCCVYTRCENHEPPLICQITSTSPRPR